MKELGNKEVYSQYSKCVRFNQSIDLYETVDKNEKFYIGEQWYGIDTGGNPAPVFNILQRTTLFQVAKITAELFAVKSKAMTVLPDANKLALERICSIVDNQFDAVVERNKMVALTREFVRNAAVDGDACFYSYFDTDIETGQHARGDIVTELVENTRVLFGNPTERDVQRQPFIIIPLRWEVDKAKRVAKENKQNAEDIKADDEENASKYDKLTDNKVTVMLYFAKDYDTGTIWHGKYTKDGIVEPLRDTELKRYPIVWMNWDYVQDCYHGYGLISQLSPNQKFMNRGHAMTMRSMMTQAWPKTIYDKTRLPFWDNGVGRAIGVTGGGDLSTIARVIDPAPISPQIAQYLQIVKDQTEELMGVSDAAMGAGRADNAAAIIALQRAADSHLDLKRKNVVQALDDLALIYLDMMRVYYGERYVSYSTFTDEQINSAPLGIELQKKNVVDTFDFNELNKTALVLQVDVGATSQWSEIAVMQTLDNLLINKLITFEDYLERVPDNRIPKRKELLAKIKNERMAANATLTPPVSTSPTEPQMPRGGDGNMQRALRETGIV